MSADSDLLERIDNESLICLRVLRDRGGQATARPMRKAAGLDQNQQVHYRMNEHLMPAGLVERVGRTSVPGAAKPAVVYGLTGKGEGFIFAHVDEIETPADIPAAAESMQRAHKAIMEYEERVDDLEDDVERLEDRLDKYSSRLSRYQNSLSELRGRVDEHAEYLSNHAGIIEDLHSAVGDLEERQEKIRTLLDRLKNRVMDI